MAKRKKDFDINRYTIEEVLGTVSEKENSDWGKFIVKARMDEHVSNIDIRNLKFSSDGKLDKIGKGISLTEVEADTLTDLLIENGFGSPKKDKNNDDEDVLGVDFIE